VFSFHSTFFNAYISKAKQVHLGTLEIVDFSETTNGLV